MNLLIVDDQMMVVRGLLNGIDWTKYGIDQAYGAMSVEGAIEIFDTVQIDVLLCDIEMPIENGLSLINWVYQKGLDTQCILLTAHAKFSYAQESVKLHVFDYILQPAPYEQIADVVYRAVEELNHSRKREFLTNRGKDYLKSEKAIVGGALHNWLSGYRNKDEISRYVHLGKLPAPQQNCVLVLLQILRWTQLKDWTPALLSFGFENIASELFGACGCCVAVTPMGEDEYAFLIWSENNTVCTVLQQQLDLFWNICQKLFNCVASIYWCEIECQEQLYPKWRELIQQKNDNVSRKNTIFQVKSKSKDVPLPIMTSKEVYRWAQQLNGEMPGYVQQQIVELLDTMCQEDQINEQILRMIYQDFLQAFYIALGKNNELWNTVLNETDTILKYCKVPTSIEEMKQFVDVVVRFFSTKEIPPEKELLQRLDAYIDSHMETEISRDELARSVFLNADYLSRQVKRATGLSLKEYVVHRKLEYAQVLLLTTHLPVAIVASKVGYYNPAHFSVAYKKLFGVTPMQTRSSASQ